MRIACLQFAPQVGDTDNNLNRADAVLNKARPEELKALDLLVLPEMAFSGYNFKSLQQIHPFLEPSGSGISSLWARTTALKFNTNVVVGYPEKVDVRHKWPASPEYYDSTMMVNGDGENVLNYRKRFLYKTDETWALEGNGGFYNGKIPGLGNTVVGICMDLKFESPWNAFEFGFHALEVEPDLIVVTMSWVTRQDNRDFSRMLAEPDMETLTYWVQRLEPLISAELEKEVTVVFCNRCGQEGDSLYAGTSAIIGIKAGEVNVYALAGRGTKEFLMADTSNPPFAKLVQGGEEPVSPGLTTWPPTPSLPLPARNAATSTISNIAPANSIAPPRSVPAAPPRITTFNQPKRDRPSPRIQIPDFGTHAFSSGSRNRMGLVSESPNTIPTPEAPSPTPLALRPKLIIPDNESGFGDSPYPQEDFLSQQFRFFGRQHHPFTPVAPEHDPAQARYYWRPSDSILNTPLDLNSAFSPSAPKINDLGSLTPYPDSDIPVFLSVANDGRRAADIPIAQAVVSEGRGTSRQQNGSEPTASSTDTLIQANTSESEKAAADRLESSEDVAHPPQPLPMPSQGTGSDHTDETPGDPEGVSLSNASPPQSLPDDRPESAAPEPRPSWLESAKSIERVTEPRPLSPKSRHASRNRSRTGSAAPEHRAYVPRPSQTPVDNIPAAKDEGRGDPALPTGLRDQEPQDCGETVKHASGAVIHTVENAQCGSARAPSVTQHADEKSSPQAPKVTLPKLAKRVPSPGGDLDEKRPLSRGRQRWSVRDPPPPYSETQNNRLVVQVQVIEPQKRAPSANTPLVPRQVSVTRLQSASGLVGIRFATPDDEIIAIEEYIDPVCNMHSKRSTSASAISHKIPSIEDGRAIVGERANLPPPPPIAVLDLTDDPPDRRVTVFRTPSVLGGSVKTTIIDMPHSHFGPGVSVLTPPLSAVFEMMSPTSPSFPASGIDTPPAHSTDQKLELTPRAMAVVQQFAALAKRIDTPFPPLACIDCKHEKSLGQPLKTGPPERVRFVEDDLPKALFADLAMTGSLRKRRSCALF